MQIHGAMLALHTSRPVKLVYGREESFVGHVHRHPAKIWAEHRATREGRLTCVRMRILLDGGAYASSSTAVTSNAASFACGPYEVPNALIESTCVYTNNPPCGAMRGFGAVQTCFAAEAQMDKLAAALGIDPVELRLLNALAPGDTLPTGQAIEGSLPTAEVIRRAAALEPPPGRGASPRPDPSPRGAGNTTNGEGVQRGTGFAVGFKNICYSEGFDDSCAARVILSGNRAEIHCAAAEVGQGVNGVMIQVARTELGPDVESRPCPGGTAMVDSSGSASASRLTTMVAGAVQLACRAALEERERTGAEEVDVERVYHHPRTWPLDPETGQTTGERSHVALAVAAMKVVAEVDVDLGLTRVVWIGTAQDVGKAINPQAVEGQIEGGTAQGLGLALMEEIQTRDGLITNASFTDYLLPTALDMPPVESVLIEDPEPGAPYGVKGVGEPPTVVSTAAIVSALRARHRPRAHARPGQARTTSSASSYFRSSSVAPPASSRIPTTRVHSSGICSTPNQPKRSISAATIRLPVITSPIVAATPIFGAAKVIESTMNALRIPPSHIHNGWWKASPTPASDRRATSSTRIPVAPATSVENPTASTVPTRSPSRPSAAACTEPAKPAEIDITTASAVPPDTSQPY